MMQKTITKNTPIIVAMEVNDLSKAITKLAGSIEYTKANRVGIIVMSDKASANYAQDYLFNKLVKEPGILKQFDQFIVFIPVEDVGYRPCYKYEIGATSIDCVPITSDYLGVLDENKKYYEKNTDVCRHVFSIAAEKKRHRDEEKQRKVEHEYHIEEKEGYVPGMNIMEAMTQEMERFMKGDTNTINLEYFCISGKRM